VNVIRTPGPQHVWLSRLGLAAVVLLCSALAAAQTSATGEAAVPKQAGIASAHYLATDAGHSILAQGGNAFDAAVAVAAVLSVVEPESSGLGGGGFFLLQEGKSGRQVFLDARETAPAAATRDMYLDAQGEPIRDLSVNGALAAGIPGQPAALVHLAERYGQLPLAQSLKPAIALASQGFPWSEKNEIMMSFRKDTIAKYPSSARQFLIRGKPPTLGARIRLPDLARTLQALGKKGREGFYGGEVAKRLVDGTRAAGGIWTLDDLKNYQVVERAPLVAKYRAYSIISSPPPSSGGVALISMLHMLEGYPYEKSAPVLRNHLLTEVMRRAYRDRAIYLGDPDFVNVPVQMLVHPYYAAGLRASIREDRATPSDMLPGIEAAPQGSDTTHFSIIDRAGNMVAATLSVNLPFGSAFVPPGTGLLLNNEMDDFSMKPGVPNAYGLVGEDANAIAPGKRPLSSMTPTFAIGPERTIVIGTPGGSRIISMVFLGLLEALEGGTAAQAVARPRIHHQYLPDTLSVEPGLLNTEQIAELEKLGHKVQVEARVWGNMHVVIWDRSSGHLDAASDPRTKVGRAIAR